MRYMILNRADQRTIDRALERGFPLTPGNPNLTLSLTLNLTLTLNLCPNPNPNPNPSAKPHLNRNPNPNPNTNPLIHLLPKDLAFSEGVPHGTLT